MAKITTIGSYGSPNLALLSTITTNTNSGSIDRLGYDHLLAFLATSSVSGTTPTFDVKVQHSTDGTNLWTDYAPDFYYANNNTANTTAAFPQVTTNGIKQLDVDLQKANRYIRFADTVGGSSPSAVTTVVAELFQREGTIPN